MKVCELFESPMDPVAAAKEMEDLNAQMVDATGEYRALRTPAALKKIADLNDKIQKILHARGKAYGSIYEDELLEGRPLDARHAMAEIRRIASELKVASSELITRYARTLKRYVDNGARAVSALELAMNLPRGKLKGFDDLYQKAMA